MATILDSVTMTEVPRTVAYGGGLPVVTHQGELKIGEFVFHVYQLSNGQRIIFEAMGAELPRG